jgi:hypothetical protein
MTGRFSSDEGILAIQDRPGEVDRGTETRTGNEMREDRKCSHSICTAG